MTNRREFIAATAATTGVFGLGLSGGAQSIPDDTRSTSLAAPAENDSPGLDLLILGGTGFIGPHMVRRALARGHAVTLFNRGRTNSGLFPGVETLIGDRNSRLEALEGRTWDAVIDNSGYVPRHVRESARLLRTATQQYLFISSILAYGNLESPSIDEDHVLGTMADESVEEVTNQTYGPMKALCEQAVVNAFPDGTTIVRPGFIVGPGDNTDRWTYWPLRVRQGGLMLVPGTPDDPLQYIDARDLANFVVHTLESRTLGTFNAVGPGEELGMKSMLHTMKVVTDSDATFTWLDSEVLERRNVFLPIWAAASGPTAGLHRISNARARSQGITFTPLEDTIRDTLAWWDALPAERQAAMRSGLRIYDGPPVQQTSSLAQQMEAEAALLAETGG